MKLEFELTKEQHGWSFTMNDGSYESEHRYDNHNNPLSRKKALLSIIRRIELSKPPNQFKIIVEE